MAKGGGTLAAQIVQRMGNGHCLLGYLNDRMPVGSPLYGGTVLGNFGDWNERGDARFIAPLHKAGHMQDNATRIVGLGIPVRAGRR